MSASVFSSCIDKDLPLIIASTPIVATAPDPVDFTLASSTIIEALYSASLVLYSAIPYSAILEFDIVNACLVYASV